MRLLDVLLPMLAILAMAFFLSQMLIPTLRDKPLFPLFRKNWRLRKQITRVHEDQENVALEMELKKEKEKIEHDPTINL